MIRFLNFRKSGAKGPKRPRWRWLIGLGLGLILLGGLGYLLVGRPMLRVLACTKKLYEHSRPLKDAFYLQDLTKAQDELVSLEEDRLALTKSLQPLAWTKAIPFFGNYYRDGEHLLRAAGFGISAGQKLLTTLEPVADVLGFKTRAMEAKAHTVDERIVGAVQVMPEIAVGLEDVRPDLLEIKKEISFVNPKRYPGFLSLRGTRAQDLLLKLRGVTDQLDELIPQAQKALETLPGILGEPGKKTYVVVFQNDKELRPTGGFWTAYALVTMEGGKIVNITSDDMYHLDDRLTNKLAAPAVYQRFLKIELFFIRDSNFSPDFVTSANQFYTFWQRIEGLPRVDGVLAVDTEFLKSLLTVLGPVKVSGYADEFDAENVVVELEKYATVLLKNEPGRKDLIGVLMDAVLTKVFQAPQNQWLPLAKNCVAQANEKHFLAYFFDDTAQALVEDYNWGGRVRAFDGDYLGVNEANFAGAKSNLYVTRKVSQTISRQKDGRWLREVTIDFENPEPYDGWLNGPYRAYVRLLVPEGAELVALEGSKESVPQESYFDEALGKQVFAAFNITNPLKTSQLIFKYTVPESVVVDGHYRLLLQKQPGLGSPEYQVALGRQTEKFELATDRELEFDAK